MRLQIEMGRRGILPEYKQLFKPTLGLPMGIH